MSNMSPNYVPDESHWSFISSVSPPDAYTGGELVLFPDADIADPDMIRNPGGYYLAQLWQTKSSNGAALVKARAHLMKLKHSGALDRHAIPLKQCGDVLLFRGSIMHAVLPVTNGTRHSLVAFYHVVDENTKEDYTEE